ncbi:MAG TPA: ArsR family transcriptional regulator [Methanoculleus sp.]|nr:ArsR family transcriptional regulator [Methanoculleus sp.]
MTITTIYYSYSGVTRGVAEKVHAACGGKLVEVTPVAPYSHLSVFLSGARRAKKGSCDVIEPATIDVTGADVIVLGTPVWASHPPPPVNGAVQALAGCSGKTVVLFATCVGQPRGTLPLIAEALAAKEVRVTREFVFTKNDVSDPARIGALIEAVKSADGNTDGDA